MQKRKQDGGGGKPNKKRFKNVSSSGGKVGIPMGTRGILVTCTTGREQQAGREAVALFSEFYEALGGTWKQTAGGADAGDADAPDAPPTDIAAALASEVAELKEGSNRPFYYHPCGINSIIYLECKDAEGPSPSQLVLAACQAAADSQQNRTRFCSRFYPVEHTCYASMDKIAELAGAVVAQHFPADAEAPIEFAVQYDARAAPQLDRMKVIDAFATLVPKPHKVNLSAPQKTILVNIMKSTCGLAVVDRFRELCRYNIVTLALPEEEREAQRAQQRAAEAARQAARQAAAPVEPEGAEKGEQQQQAGGEETAGGEPAAVAEGQGQQQEEAAAEAPEEQQQEAEPAT